MPNPKIKDAANNLAAMVEACAYAYLDRKAWDYYRCGSRVGPFKAVFRIDGQLDLACDECPPKKGGRR